MLGKYEQRNFEGNEKIWIGRYRNLTNILHWHSECELIRIVKGSAEIKIGDNVIIANENNCVFCPKQELHYITSLNDTLIDVIIFHKDLLKSINDKYKLVSPLIINSDTVNNSFDVIRSLITNKPRFYNETIELKSEEILLDIFNNNEICQIESEKDHDKQINKRILDKINENFATITFEEIVLFSGYSASHFSKVFKNLAGINFSNYLNHLKVSHAVSLIQNNKDINCTDISVMCGFSTIRSFNRIFKQITGFAPSKLPDSFTTDFSISIYGASDFDPTSETSVLL